MDSETQETSLTDLLENYEQKDFQNKATMSGIASLIGEKIEEIYNKDLGRAATRILIRQDPEGDYTSSEEVRWMLDHADKGGQIFVEEYGEDEVTS